MNDTFATVLNCMDGRLQVPVVLYLLDRFGVDHIDTITESGMVRFLSDLPDTPQCELTFNSLGISIKAHGSKQIAVVAHHGCAGNPIPDDEHQTQLEVAVEYVKRHFPQCEVLGLWVDSDWVVHEVFSV
ncbi:MAG: hypothetical protein O7G85_10345 [Planctomycetota bacterium]|nr:hypothetical protein [Planctomycetota bacterium]